MDRFFVNKMESKKLNKLYIKEKVGNDLNKLNPCDINMGLVFFFFPSGFKNPLLLSREKTCPFALVLSIYVNRTGIRKKNLHGIW